VLRALDQHGVVGELTQEQVEAEVGLDPVLEVAARVRGGALEGERKDQLLASIPVGRNGTVHDVADLITYLCREESGYITGATYDVNGGAHIH
jgi:NAD(P)-dependent dehydrogenase (short-subunit alcohol dehydrogenase family)